ncbi:hypothetical protein WME79_00635 [Sorangium sp. So ce726]|uniref:hypothetical protein n=1 Tax=Sorangium sp. So ce726 TaxID=3133319 RepID=UPI003F5E4D3E
MHTCRNGLVVGASIVLTTVVLGACGGDDDGGGTGAQSSTGGSLVCPMSQPTACPPAASTYCADTTSDANNCGGCGMKCGAGQACSESACVCPPANPDACSQEGSTICTKLATDPEHCGTCDNACATSEACVEGTCRVVCEPQQTTCPASGGQPAYCASLSTTKDCGACGNACALDHTCSGAEGSVGCVVCVPSVASATDDVPTPPAGWKVTCLTTPCPIVRCGELTFWVYSDTNNEELFGVTGYDAQDNLVKGPVTVTGDRYISSITLDPATETANLIGQNGGTGVQVPWSMFRLP